MSTVGPQFPATTDETRGLLMTTTVAQTLGASDVLSQANVSTLFTFLGGKFSQAWS